jgi:hypothetical protein
LISTGTDAVIKAIIILRIKDGAVKVVMTIPKMKWNKCVKQNLIYQRKQPLPNQKHKRTARKYFY